MITAKNQRHHFGPFSERTLELYLCGDLGPDEAELIEKAMAECSPLAVYLRKRVNQRTAFLVQHPFRTLEPKLPKSRSIVRKWGLAVAFVAVAFSMFLVMVPGWRSGPETEPLYSGIRARGPMSVHVVAQRNGRTMEVRNGTYLKVGDRIRIRLDAGHGGYVYVLGFDSEGRVDIYYGGEETGPVRVSPGEAYLPMSLELDGTSTRDRLHIALCEILPPAGFVDAWAHSLRSRPQGMSRFRSCDTTSLTLRTDVP